MTNLLHDAMHSIIVIVGPSASGKSAVALELAKKIGGEIVNADSRQIYKYLDAGTAKPNSEERKVVPHHLYDFLNPKETYSAGQYVKDATAAICKIISRRKHPVVVGGTGLYIRALFDGLAPLPQKDESLRKKLLKIAEEKGRKYLHEKLREVDSVSAEKIPHQNIQRVIRALEVYEITQKPISILQKKLIEPKNNFKPVLLGLRWEKTELKDRILKRTERILPAMILETDWLLKNGFDDTNPGLQSLGYKTAIQYIRHQISYEDFFNVLLQDTLRYTKRQMTWFKRDDRIRWIDLYPPFNPEEVAEHLIRFMI